MTRRIAGRAARRAALSEEIVQAMTDPAFYPHEPSVVELRETHISWVFLAGERVYKVKKPVVLPFLDYGSLERRRRFCLEEVRLNRRLADDLYLGVRSVVRCAGGLCLAYPEHFDALEYAVEMRRFPEERTLARSIKKGSARAGSVRALAARLADFHTRAAQAPEPYAGTEGVARPMVETFDSLLAMSHILRSGDEILAVRRFAEALRSGWRDLFVERAQGGHVRECHGDLRAEHVILGEKIRVFDCVEFDPALRMIDVAADLAFLVMDLERLGRPDLSRVLEASYRCYGGDPGPRPLLLFYAVYRACVRAKVATVRFNQLPEAAPAREIARAEAVGLLALARRLCWQARLPLLVVVCGPSASGKTRLAEEIARVGGLDHISSDRTRKELAGIGATDRGQPALYTSACNERTYAELGRRCGEELALRGGAVADGTFRRRADRRVFLAALRVPAGARVIFAECRAPRAVLLERARRREAEGLRVSDATLDVVERQIEEFEPLEELPSLSRVALDTTRSPARVAQELEEELDRLLFGRTATGGSACLSACTEPPDRGHDKLPTGGHLIPHPSGSGSTVRCSCTVDRREDADEERKDPGGDHRFV